MTNSTIYKYAREYKLPYTTVTIDLVKKIRTEVLKAPCVDSRGYDITRKRKSLVKRLDLRLKNLRRITL